jgi:hypothetical protein
MRATGSISGVQILQSGDYTFQLPLKKIRPIAKMFLYATFQNKIIYIKAISDNLVPLLRIAIV